jgi:hypothetical protein
MPVMTIASSIVMFERYYGVQPSDKHRHDRG